ncbi:inositol oxygenase-like [Thrips palmi]|uniref:Inositol oxygenase n=1 Tax=Thrips palmi TaxID=161013 RepID=A0A6P8YKL8_THRPL|nr:inositol oxygenase-like [Thrips palmi]
MELRRAAAQFQSTRPRNRTAPTAMAPQIKKGDAEVMLDASELLRPEPTYTTKPVAQYRDFSVDPTDPIKERVRLLYLDMHTHQTYDFVKSRHDKWLKFDHFKGTIMDVLNRLSESGLTDQSDPDVDIPNVYHGFQTAEGIRREHPDKEWFQLTGLIHDIGKIMALYDEPQWAVLGDTFVVGCEWGPSIVYRDTSFHNNPDGKHPIYSTKNGIYKPHCGLENVIMSWGHDEYLYQVLKHNKAKLPEEALYMIRFHSFYPWHAGGDYMHLCNEKDKKMMEWVLEFNKYDLYTKSDEDLPDMNQLTSYYQGLVDKYIPGELEW